MPVPYLRFEAGSNVSFGITTNASSHATLRIAAAGGAAPGGEFVAAAWPSVPGESFETHTRGFALYPLENISIKTTPEIVSGSSLLGIGIEANIPSGAFQLFAFNTVLGGSINATQSANVAPQLRLEAGSNISFNVTTGNIATVRIAAAQQYAFNNSGGSMDHTYQSAPYHLMRFEAGTNVSLNVSTNASRYATLRINAGGGFVGVIQDSDYQAITNAQGLFFYAYPPVQFHTWDTVVNGSSLLAAGIDVSLPRGFHGGVFNLGNTQGQTGLVSGQLVLAGGANITLSQLRDITNDVATVTINGAAQSFAFNTVAGGSINSTLMSRTVPLLRFEAGEGIGFGVTTNGSSGTLRISAVGAGAAPGAGGISRVIVFQQSGGSTSGHSNLDGVQELNLYAASNVTITASSYAGNLAEVRIAAGGGGADNRFLVPAVPIIPMYSTVLEVVQNSVHFVPFNPGHLGSRANMSAGMPMMFNFTTVPASTTGTWRGTFGISLGVYTRTGASLSRMSSGSMSATFAVTNGSNNENFWRMRLVRITNMGSMSFDNRDYWLGVQMTTSSATNNVWSIFPLGYELMSGDWRDFGNSNATFQPIPGWGAFSGSWPATVAFSNIVGTQAVTRRAPVAYFYGWTT